MAEAESKGGWKTGALAGVGGLLIGGVAVAGYYGFRAPDRAATEEIVRDYILANGEILPEAMERLQARQASAAVGQHRAALERPFHGAWAGAEDGDVVLVQFFDYACGYCRTSNPVVERLLREDPRLKVVWREFPVLGPGSEQAATASLAAAQAGRFRQFHDALFGSGRPTEANLAAAVAATSLADVSLTADRRTELQRNFELARALGFSGTPTFIVGDRVLQGAVGYDVLKQAIAAARRS
jgi:protein-disulfide isomerase